jgi:hypothetical protein
MNQPTIPVQPERPSSGFKRTTLYYVLSLAILATVIYLARHFVAHAKNATFLTNGLVAYYPLNGNAHDASGNGKDGEVAGATPCPDRFGKASSAYSFNGVDNYIRFGEVPLNQVDNWTISAWINPASIDQFGTAVCLGHDDGNTGDGIAFGLNQDCYTPGNHLDGTLGGVTWADSGYEFPAANQWYHVVMLRTNGATMYYVNGVPTPREYTDAPVLPTAFTIGSSTGIRFFNGQIGEVRIYDRALSAAEVNQLYLQSN